MTLMQKKDPKTGEKAVGRRKTAAARVRLTLGKGDIVVNGRALNDYFPVKIWQEKVRAPLVAVGKEKDFDVSVKAAGGGVHAQAEAVRRGIARALVRWNEEFKKILRAEGFLTRDPRA